MSHDAEYNKRQIHDKLVGGMIVQAWSEGERFGFLVLTKNGGTRDVQVQSDAEGNDSGWLDIGDELPKRKGRE